MAANIKQIWVQDKKKTLDLKFEKTLYLLLNIKNRGRIFQTEIIYVGNWTPA